MAGIIRLSNTGTGNGQSTITTAASGDVTYTLPSGGGTFVTTASTQALTVPFASGTVSAPSITFLGDSNTGIYSPVADTIAFTEGGVESLRIDSSGRVGLGTSSPGDFQFYAKSAGAYSATFETTTDQSSNSASRRIVFTARNFRPSIEGQFLSGTWQSNDLLINPSGGNVGIGTTAPGSLLTVSNGTVLMDVSPFGTVGYFGTSTNHALAFIQNNTERGRFDSSGRLLVGTSSSRSVGGAERLVQVEGTSASTSNISIVRNSNDISQPSLNLGKSRGTSNGSVAAVLADDGIGSIIFTGADGTSLITAAAINALVDGTPGANDMPGRLVFSTTADGSSSPTERMRITNQGRVLVNKTAGTSTVSPGIEVTAPNTNLAEFAFEIRDNTNADLIIAASNGNYLRSTTVYARTSANAANITVDSNGYIYRSTSSIKYKTSIETIQPAYSEALLNCRPVWYRSKSERDNPHWGWWGFIAEEVAEIDPRLVQWRTTKTELDENGKFQDVVLDQPEPEGVQYDRFVPHLLNLIKHQKEQIEAIEARLTALEQA